METIITPLNKDQFPSNNQGETANKINGMLKISLNKLIKQIIYKISNKMQRNVYKKVRSNKKKYKLMD